MTDKGNESSSGGEDPASMQIGGVPHWLPRASLSVLLVILAVMVAVWFAARLRNLIFMVFIALFISVALEPAVQTLSKRGWPRRKATPLVFTVSLLVGAGFVAALVPLFVSQAAGLVDNLPRYITSLQAMLAEFELFDIELVDAELIAEFEDLGSLLGRYGGSVAGGVFALSNTVLSAVFQTVTIALFAYYMVAEGPRMRRAVLGVFPPKRQRELLMIWEIAVQKTGGYIYSRLVLAVVAAGFTAVVLMVLDLPYVVALGLWVGVISQFVPVVGTYIAAVLPVLVALVDDPIKALWVLVALVGYQQIENYVVAPRITAKAMAIHPAISVGAVIAGASLLGGVGAVLALPVAATIQAFIATALERHEVVEDDSLGDDRPV
ncbi:MAG: AI-2E family transporter [Acidimicrobiia bacterium]